VRPGVCYVPTQSGARIKYAWVLTQYAICDMQSLVAAIPVTQIILPLLLLAVDRDG